MPTVTISRRAMGTVFEVRLLGPDREHLAAVAEATLDEISRLERLLSRFLPASEICRLNREAASHPIRVDQDLMEVLIACREGWERTEGYFDVTIGPLVGCWKQAVQEAR